MQARSQTIYTPTMMSTMIVASKMKPVVGPYLKPRMSGAASPTTHWIRTAIYGERYRGWSVLRKRGSMRMRPRAKAMRVETFEPALALAIVELTTARKTRTQKMPYDALATPCQESAPAPVNLVNLPGPYAMSMA